jgi:hypothetical protein
MVGAEGFEPSTFWSRTKRATSLRYAPIKMMSMTNELYTLQEQGDGVKGKVGKAENASEKKRAHQVII